MSSVTQKEISDFQANTMYQEPSIKKTSSLDRVINSLILGSFFATLSLISVLLPGSSIIFTGRPSKNEPSLAELGFEKLSEQARSKSSPQFIPMQPNE